jgi:hypothetical protein
MKRTKIQTFNSGICSIYKIGNNDVLSLKIGGIRFDDRTVGSERFFKAADFQLKASKMIRIPFIDEPKANDIIVIGENQYNMIQVQSIYDTYPKCWQITLQEIKEANRYDI